MKLSLGIFVILVIINSHGTMGKFTARYFGTLTDIVLHNKCILLISGDIKDL